MAFTHGRGAFVRRSRRATYTGRGVAGGEPAQQMRASYQRATGAIDLTYTPACEATDHAVLYGPLTSVSGYGYSGAACHVGTSGAASFVPGPETSSS